MTTGQVRDEIARLDGWTLEEDGMWYKAGEWPRKEHPFPPTLDGAASALPKGWEWTLAYHYDGVKRWAAQDKNCRNTQMKANTGNEIYDRYALALAAMKAERGTNGN